MNEKVRKLVTMAMLAALSIVLVYVIHFPIFPAASFLEYDPADIPILIGTFAYGPLAGVLLTVVVSVIQGMTVSSGSGLMGIAMHIFATSILVLVAGNIYRVKHTKKGAVLALICGVLAMTAGMVVFNYFITPYFITPDLADTAAVAANREFVKTLLVPVIVIFTVRRRRKMSEASRRVKERTAGINADIESSISGVRAAKAFGNEAYEMAKFEQGNSRYRGAKKEFYKQMGIFQSGMDFLTSSMNVVVIAFGGLLIMQGGLDFLDLTTFVLYIGTFLQPIRRLSSFVEQYTVGMAGFRRFRALMGTK